MVNIAHSNTATSAKDIAIEIQPLSKDDIPEAAQVLTSALIHNPIQIAVYQDISPEIQERVLSKFRMIMEHPIGEVFIAKNQNNTIIGVYRIKQCPANPFPYITFKTPAPANLQTLHQRETYWYNTWRQNEPEKSHSHLGPIGVLPSYQHQGIGSKLLEHYCQQLDTRHLSAYLEADKWKNVLFYQRFGFEIIHETRILDTDTYFMWREASSE